MRKLTRATLGAVLAGGALFVSATPAMASGDYDGQLVDITINDVDILNGTDLTPWVAAAICGVDVEAVMALKEGEKIDCPLIPGAKIEA